MGRRVLVFLMLLAFACAEAFAADSPESKREALMKEIARKRMIEKSGGEEGFRSLCSGVKKCLNIDYGFCSF